MSKRNRLVIEGEVSKATLQVLLDKISERLDSLEGRSGPTTLIDTLTLSQRKRGMIFRAGFFTINQRGIDLQSISLGFGAFLTEDGQWVALQPVATIQDFDNISQTVKYFYNTGLTPGVSYTPTLTLTVAI